MLRMFIVWNISLDESAQFKPWLLDTSATWAGLIKAPYSSCWGSLLQDGEREVKVSVTSAPWKGERGEQEREMQSFTDLLLPCDLPTRLPLDEGG